jgi:hypothetical protein
VSVLYSPVDPGSDVARVDQGVDYSQSDPYRAVAAGTVTKISPAGSWAGGTGEAVYEQLANPIVVGGRSYSQVYYAEEHPLVALHQSLQAGQPVMQGGGAEIGFASGGNPVAPLVGGLGSGTQSTQPGYDFQTFASQHPSAPGSPSSVTSGGTAQVPATVKGHSVPPELATVIAQSSQQYGLPPDLLAGIWGVESGYSYPDTAHNTSGYGGLFGTSDYSGTPQQQANTAASILAGLINEYHSVPTALHEYSSGTTSGGYGSVPGELPSSAALTSATTISGTQQGTSDGGAGGSQLGSGSPPAGFPPAGTPASSITTDQVKTIMGAILNNQMSEAQVNAWYPGANVHNNTWGLLSSVPNTIEEAISSAVSSIESTASGWFWRAVKLLGGALLMMAAAYGIFRALASGGNATVAEAVATRLPGELVG